jgi:hypothetical protein
MRVRNPFALFIDGPPQDWQPKAGESVYLLVNSVAVVSGVIQDCHETTHWSGQTERWYMFQPEDGGQSIACGRNSILPNPSFVGKEM